MNTTEVEVKNAKLAAVFSSILELEKEAYETKLKLIQASSISDQSKVSIMTVSIENIKQRIDYLKQQYNVIELE